MEEVLLGCWREAQRADKVAAHLSRLRTVLDAEFHDHISAVLREVESGSRLLRDLYDLFPIYRARVPIIVYYLNIILPSLCKTLQTMMIYLDHESLSPKTQWTLMYERLGDQGGMSLAARHVMYCEFLVQLIRLLSRSPLYDPTTLELLRMRHLRLRMLQGILGWTTNLSLIPLVLAVPPPIQPHLAAPQPSQADLERRHWAEKVFENQPRSTISLKHRRGSRCFGPPMIEQALGMPPGSTVLFKLPFDKNRLSVTLYLHAEGADVTRLLVRWMDRYFNPLYSAYGIHELCVRRKGSSLQFRRCGSNRSYSTLWMALFFKSWEKMVLFHSSFVTLKARCPLTISVNAEDYHLAGETRAFQGQIVDDGFHHSLAVYQDNKCHGLRLHAAVWNGELRKCPVWTAFITYQITSPDWLERRSRHRIWLKDIQPFVFCKKYKKRHQVRKHGEFELYFVDEDDADAFEDIFREETDVGSVLIVPEGGGGGVGGR